MMTKMLSLDTSSTCTGYAEFINGKLSDSGIIDYRKSKLESDERLLQMKFAIVELLKEKQPHIVVTEVSRSNNNIRNQRIFSELNGVIQGCCLMNDVEFVTYAPSIWRMFVRETGETMPRKNKELKVWGINRCKELFPEIEPATDDEADAILIGQARINEFDKLTEV